MNMNRNLMIAIGILILVIAGGGLFVLNQQNKTSEDGVMKKEESAEKDSSMTKEGSRYIEYSKAALDNSSSKRRVLYFYANWCPVCRPLDKEISENTDKIPEDVLILRVNYNDSDTDQEEKDLAKKYGITYQHTFVQIDANGNDITKWSGGDLEEILRNIK